MDKETRKRVRAYVMSRAPSSYFQWNSLPAGTMNGTLVHDQRTAKSPTKKSSRKKSKKSTKSKVREMCEPLTDGQPRFEGGIRWEQGGLPSLGKRR